jgi:3-oxoacyl-[acyl-carrier-protein] synthase-1
VDKIILLSLIGFSDEQLEKLRTVSPRLNVQQMTGAAFDDIPIANEHVKTFSTGRTSGIHAVDMAYRYFSTGNHPYVLVGSGDSYFNYSRILQLSRDKRLLTEASDGGFAAGESAAFILLTNKIENAVVHEGRAICIHAPGIADEPGHLYSEETNRGDGLDKAFKGALTGERKKTISRIYSSLNGEQFWAKELGVATIRNRDYFTQDYRIEHPVDCLGDMGAATAPVLIGLAAADLLADKQLGSALIYCSSDYSSRAAVRIESVAA